MIIPQTEKKSNTFTYLVILRNYTQIPSDYEGDMFCKAKCDIFDFIKCDIYSLC